MSKIKIYAKNILIPIAVGVVIGLITSNSMDLSTLQRPALTPPGVLFPIVWTILYTLMGISTGILEVNKEFDGSTKSIYYAQLFVNALWSIIFFTLKLRLFAFIWVILLDVLVLLMIMNFYRKNKTAGLLQIPYLVWVLFATYLNLGIYLLNSYNS